MNNNEDFEEMIKKYQDEMQKYISTQKPQKYDEDFENDNHFDDEFDDSAINYKDYLTSDVVVPVVNDATPNNENNSSEYPAAFGTITISTATANGAVPIKGALVTVTEKTPSGSERLLYNVTTNEDGETVPLELKTLPLELSQTPDFMGKPYMVYDIRTSKDGYFTVLNKGVPIFDNMNSVQPVNLIPLPENFSGNTTIEYAEPEQLEGGINAGGNDDITNKADEKS